MSKCLYTTTRYLDGGWVFDISIRSQFLFGVGGNRDRYGAHVALYLGPITFMVWRLAKQK